MILTGYPRPTGGEVRRLCETRWQQKGVSNAMESAAWYVEYYAYSERFDLLPGKPYDADTTIYVDDVDDDDD